MKTWTWEEILERHPDQFRTYWRTLASDDPFLCGNFTRVYNLGYQAALEDEREARTHND